MAEAYLRHRLEEENPSIRHRVTSAGTLGIVGDGPAPMAAAIVMQESHLDLSSHRSRGVVKEEVEDADLILVMEAVHLRHLQTLYSAHARKIRLLTDFAPPGRRPGRGADVFDPVGQGPEAFRDCYHLIQACLDNVVKSLSG